MIRRARALAPAAEFRVGSFLSTELPPCDAVTSMGECVNYAFDRSSGKQGLGRFFRRVCSALRPGGVFIFDIVEPGVAGGAPARKFLEGPDWAILLEAAEDRRRKTLTQADRELPADGKAVPAQRRDAPIASVLRGRTAGGIGRGGFQGTVTGRVRPVPIPAGACGFRGAEAAIAFSCGLLLWS